MTGGGPRVSGAFDPARVPRIGVTVDVVLLTIRGGQLSVLLVQRGVEPFAGSWALPGGFLHEGESLDAAAARVLRDETSLAAFPGHLEQLRTFGAPDRDPRMHTVSVAYLGLMPDLPTPDAGRDSAAARYWPVVDVGTAEGPALAFDHDRVLAEGVERARAKLEYTPLAAAFVEEPFTLADLRRIYESVWGVEVHRGNFRRKVLSTPGFVVALGATAPAGPEGGRPADLYRRGPASMLHPAMLRPPRDPDVKAAGHEEGEL